MFKNIPYIYVAERLRGIRDAVNCAFEDERESEVSVFGQFACIVACSNQQLKFFDRLIKNLRYEGFRYISLVSRLPGKDGKQEIVKAYCFYVDWTDMSEVVKRAKDVCNAYISGIDL